MPYAFVFSSKDEIGTVKKVNLLFTSLFGYPRDEIIDKNINLIMPEIYANSHDMFLRRYIEAGVEESEYFDKDHTLFAKIKSGYILPITSVVRLFFCDFMQGCLFIGVFKTNNITKNMIYLICNKDGVILDISSPAIVILKLEYN